MALKLACGNDWGLEELLKACLAQVTNLAGTHPDLAWKVIRKTWAAAPAECGRKLTFEEKLKSTISVQDCTGTPVIGINVVLLDCECLACGTELPCNYSDVPLFQLAEQAFCYTTEDEWAFYVMDNYTGRAQ